MNKITLTINNKKLDFYFGLGFLGNALEDIGIGIDELGVKLTSNPFLYAPKLMYYSLEYGYIRKGKDFNMSLESFIDELDKDKSFINGNIGKFLDAFTKSLTKDVPIDKGNSESKKK